MNEQEKILKEINELIKKLDEGYTIDKEVMDNNYFGKHHNYVIKFKVITK